jgi:PBP1b-binding outer membrane lipoprotein LpoB
MQGKTMSKNILLLIVSTLLFVGCGQATNTGSEPEDAASTSFEEVYAAAEKALAAAIARRNVWSKTEEMLDNSKIAFESGDVATAIELATEAKLQAELALTQADFEEDAWRSRVLSE